MKRLDIRPNPERVLAGLKDFQRQTVEHVFQRLYVDEPITRRFLIADEVGLGKTLVARGLLARAIDRIWDTTRRIDVVYICSNGDIARQNIRRLNVSGGGDVALASRITMLPLEMRALQGRKLNFVSFTPGTSFDLKSKGGMAQERALLCVMLEQVWGLKGRAPGNVFQGGMKPDNFRRKLDWCQRHAAIDEELLERFEAALAESIAADRAAGRLDVRTRFDQLCETFRRARSSHDVPAADRHLRHEFTGDMRSLLARTCLGALKPDVIILDEFQRFKHLLSGEDEAARLARALFNYSDEHSSARVLLLSATPYKMYTTAQESGNEDHYSDFLRTVDFLVEDPREQVRFRQLVAEYRRSILEAGAGGSGDRLAKTAAELSGRLRRVMVRTERLAATPDRDGMLATVPSAPLLLDVDQLRAYLAVQQITRALGQYDVLELWKSSPYLLNFMEGYKLKQEFRRVTADASRWTELQQLMRAASRASLPWSAIEAYERVDPQNARLAWLLGQTVDRDVWRLLWLPPSLPYYPLRGAFANSRTLGFTKHLVFSAWNVVPKAIAAILSYEAERRLMEMGSEQPQNTPEARKRVRPPLLFRREDGRAGAMSVFTLLYPSPTLAEVGDLVRHGLADGTRSYEEIRAALELRIHGKLSSLLGAAPAAGPEDPSWYWAGPVLLDLLEHRRTTFSWLNRANLWTAWVGAEDASVDALEEEDATGFQAHIAELVAFARRAHEGGKAASNMVRTSGLGRPPADLASALTSVALGAPATLALRMLRRFVSRPVVDEPVHHDGAARIAWGFRSLFNLPEAISLIRGLEPDLVYWRAALEYAAGGCLSSVLDEYGHLLRETEGFDTGEPAALLHGIAERMHEALSLRTGSLTVDELVVGPEGEIGLQPRRMRSRFALRFGDLRSEEEGTRGDQVRAAFNSPFWPFVLCSTSIGQEGLDFHCYAHAVVHWNLPSNPVDLEQREGRVHRYKGHAVRKNVSASHHRVLAGGIAGDPWSALFAQAASGRDPRLNDLVPYWVYPVPGGARIERHVPALPLSRDTERFESLQKALAAYRLVFGQPRQEELLSYLLERIRAERLEEFAALSRIDLSPPTGESRQCGGPTEIHAVHLA